MLTDGIRFSAEDRSCLENVQILRQITKVDRVSTCYNIDTKTRNLHHVVIYVMSASATHAALANAPQREIGEVECHRAVI